MELESASAPHSPSLSLALSLSLSLSPSFFLSIPTKIITPKHCSRSPSFSLSVSKKSKMKKQQRKQNAEGASGATEAAEATGAIRPSPSAHQLLPLVTRRSISMGDFRRAAPSSGSEPPSAPATAPSSKLVTPSSSMEFEAARRRLLEVEERQRVILEMERRLEELREVFVRSERRAVEHGELVAHITAAAQQGELCVSENGQRLKKGLRFKQRHRPTVVFASVLGLRTCLPWPVKLK